MDGTDPNKQSTNSTAPCRYSTSLCINKAQTNYIRGSRQRHSTAYHLSSLTPLPLLTLILGHAGRPGRSEGRQAVNWTQQLRVPSSTTRQPVHPKNPRHFLHKHSKSSCSSLSDSLSITMPGIHGGRQLTMNRYSCTTYHSAQSRPPPSESGGSLRP